MGWILVVYKSRSPVFQISLNFIGGTSSDWGLLLQVEPLESSSESRSSLDFEVVFFFWKTMQGRSCKNWLLSLDHRRKAEQNLLPVVLEALTERSQCISCLGRESLEVCKVLTGAWAFNLLGLSIPRGSKSQSSCDILYFGVSLGDFYLLCFYLLFYLIPQCNPIQIEVEDWSWRSIMWEPELYCCYCLFASRVLQRSSGNTILKFT